MKDLISPWDIKLHWSMQPKGGVFKGIDPQKCKAGTTVDSRLPITFSRMNLSLAGCSPAEPAYVSVQGKSQKEKLYLQPVNFPSQLPESLNCVKMERKKVVKAKNSYIGFFFALFFIISGVTMLYKDLVGIGINSRTQSFSAVGGPLFIFIGFIFLGVGYYGLSPYSKIRRFFEDSPIRKKESRKKRNDDKGNNL